MIDDDITVDQIYAALERVRPIAVVFDTLNTYIGKADTHKSSESTQAMNLFKDLARRFDCAAIVLRHLTKVSTTRAIYRGQGSQAFAGVARVIMTVGVSPDDPDTRVVAVTKSNLSRIPRALTFTIEEIQGKRDRSRLIWGSFADLTSDDILSVDNSKHKEARAEKTQIIEYVKELLQRNPMTPEEIKQSCDVRGYNGARLPKLRHEIGARIIRLKKDGRTRLMWELR